MQEKPRRVYSHVLSQECSTKSWHTNTCKYSKNVTKFNYLETTLTNQNCIHAEMSTLNSGNICYWHSIQDLFYSYILSKMLRLKYAQLKSCLFHSVAMNRMLSWIFWCKRERVNGCRRELHSVEFHTLHSNKGQGDGWGTQHAWQVLECKVFLEKTEEKRTLERPNYRCKIIIRIHLQEIKWKYVDWIMLLKDFAPCGELVSYTFRYKSATVKVK